MVITHFVQNVSWVLLSWRDIPVICSQLLSNIGIFQYLGLRIYIFWISVGISATFYYGTKSQSTRRKRVILLDKVVKIVTEYSRTPFCMLLLKVWLISTQLNFHSIMKITYYFVLTNLSDYCSWLDNSRLIGSVRLNPFFLHSKKCYTIYILCSNWLILHSIFLRTVKLTVT